MIKTPITVYVDFKLAKAIKARSAGLGLSRSQWLNRCAQAALSSAIPAELPRLLGDDYVLSALDIWLEAHPDAASLHERIAARMHVREAERAVRSKEHDEARELLWAEIGRRK